MKKNLYLFGLILLSLSSCSKDENTSSESSSPILVKKIINTINPNDVVILTYKYDGNKIISESDDQGFVSTYTYTENVITKIEERVDNKFQSSKEYTYVNGKVATQVWKQNYGGTDSYTYTYNSNGTVSYKRTRTGSENTTGMLTFKNGNIVKNEVFYGGKYPSTVTYIYDYDSKNNPFKNVLGFNLLLETDEDMFSLNNMIQDGGGFPTFYFTFKYDANGYPIEKKYPSSEFNQYFY